MRERAADERLEPHLTVLVQPRRGGWRLVAGCGFAVAATDAATAAAAAAAAAAASGSVGEVESSECWARRTAPYVGRTS